MDMDCNNTYETVMLHVDNQGALALAKNLVQHQRSKHIDIRYHFVRDEVRNGVVNLVYVPSEDNLADVFTKPVTMTRLSKYVCLMGSR